MAGDGALASWGDATGSLLRAYEELPTRVWETGCLCQVAGMGVSVDSVQEKHLHKLGSGSLEDTDPKGGGRRPKAESCQHIQGRGGAGPALDTSPCLALVETPRPSGRQKGPPQVGPETTWFCLGSTTRSMENSPGTTGQQVSQPLCGPLGFPC